MMERASSIPEFIDESKDQELTTSILFFKEIVTNNENQSMITFSECILDKYRDDLSKIIVDYTMTPDECSKYFYNPQRYCYDEYGTTEYWMILLDINQMHSAADFCTERIKIFKSSLSTIVNKILNLEDENIQINDNNTNV